LFANELLCPVFGNGEEMSRAENLVLLGQSGVGKSRLPDEFHLLIIDEFGLDSEERTLNSMPGTPLRAMHRL